MENKIINSYTEIYTTDADNFLTQSYPTNFHQFYKRKMLTRGESIEDYKEVSEAEKTALEKADASWVEPPQSFVDLWNKACGSFGQYNKTTGFFELNGLVDISYEEALSIIKHSEFNRLPTSAQNYFARVGSVRTLMPIRMNGIYNLPNAFHGCSGLEVLNFLEINVNSCAISSLSEAFKFCQNLKRIIGSPLIVTNERNLVSAFEQCYKLEEIYLWLHQASVSLKDCKNLKKDSLVYMVEHGDNSTITVHPDVYAKLTDETNVEWHKILTDALARNITFTTI